jgi:type 1 fimbriae regulatory protein FimB/type 1 fimbriae regulatory protein FimE
MSNVIHLAVPRAEPQSPKTGKMPPRRRPNAELRSREHLTPEEVSKLMAAARRVGRNQSRDEALVLIAYRHGLRVSELVALRWSDVDLKSGLVHVTRRKNGTPSTHPLQGDELRALRALRRDWPDSPYLFASERAGAMTASNVRKLVARLGVLAGIGFPVHPHNLRHACGYSLVQAGHDTRRIQLWLGHRNIAHTVRYTQLGDQAFKDFWRE